jgi:hypothetical protein
MNKVAIIGSRNFWKPKLVTKYIRKIAFSKTEKECDCSTDCWYTEEILRDDLTILSGHNGNVDLTAENYAKELGIPTEIYPADWKQYGKQAAALRNQKIADACDRLIAFFDGYGYSERSGTLMTVEMVAKLSKPFVIFTGYENV